LAIDRDVENLSHIPKTKIDSFYFIYIKLSFPLQVQTGRANKSGPMGCVFEQNYRFLVPENGERRLAMFVLGTPP
jgi:hypothetical protein